MRSLAETVLPQPSSRPYTISPVQGLRTLPLPQCHVTSHPGTFPCYLLGTGFGLATLHSGPALLDGGGTGTTGRGLGARGTAACLPIKHPPNPAGPSPVRPRPESKDTYTQLR